MRPLDGPDVNEKHKKALFQAALDCGYVSYNILLKAYFDDDESFPKLLDKFQQNYGSVDRFYWCFGGRSGVALTLKKPKIDRLLRRSKRTYLHAVADVGNPSISQVLAEVDNLRINAGELLLRRERRTCLESLYVVSERLLALADKTDLMTSQGNISNIRESLAPMKEEIVAIEKYYHRSALRRLLGNYLGGMLAGILFVALLAYLIRATFSVLDPSTALFGAFISGAVGSVVSVMTRMSSEGFTLPEEVGPWQMRFLGGFRPLIGSVFAVVLFLALVSGIAPSAVAIPAEMPGRLYFFIVLGFLAGFSERFATDIFSAAERGLGGSPANSAKK